MYFLPLFYHLAFRRCRPQCNSGLARQRASCLPAKTNRTRAITQSRLVGFKLSLLESNRRSTAQHTADWHLWCHPPFPGACDHERSSVRPARVVGSSGVGWDTKYGLPQAPTSHECEPADSCLSPIDYLVRHDRRDRLAVLSLCSSPGQSRSARY